MLYIRISIIGVIIMALPRYMHQEENKLIFKDKGEIIYYIPEKFFDLNLAYLLGEYLETMGIFMYSYSKSPNSDKPEYYKHFKYPTMIRCNPAHIEKKTKLLLPGCKDVADYRLVHFLDGNELLSEIRVAQAVANVEKFVNLFKGGNMPTHIPYTELHEYWVDNAKLNGFNYNVTTQIIGIIISQCCRDSTDLSKPFRYAKTNDMLAYKALPMTKIPKYTSTYTAFTSEDPDEAIASSIINKGGGRSPLEDIMMN